jgi:hypothetical protein
MAYGAEAGAIVTAIPVLQDGYARLGKKLRSRWRTRATPSPGLASGPSPLPRGGLIRSLPLGLPGLRQVPSSRSWFPGLPRRDVCPAPVEAIEEALRNREGITYRPATSEPAGDGLRRNAGQRSRACYVDPVIVTGQFGQAEEPTRGYAPSGANGFGQRTGVCREFDVAVLASLMTALLPAVLKLHSAFVKWATGRLSGFSRLGYLRRRRRTACRAVAA